MDWGHIFDKVFELYVVLVGVGVAYFAAASFTASCRSSKNPPTIERLWRNLTCVLILAFLMGFLFLGEGEDEDGDEIPSNPNRAMIIFIVLLAPTLHGVAVGFRTDDKKYFMSKDSSGDW